MTIRNGRNSHFHAFATNYLAENEANPEALSQREATVYVAKMIAFLFVQTCSEAGDIRQMESRQIMRQMAFLADPAVKHLELPLCEFNLSFAPARMSL